MSKPETTFTNGVHKHLPAGRSDPYWMKNNNMYTSGIWDCWYSGPFADLWAEYKFEVLPARDGTIVPIDLSELQKDWGEKRYAEGRNLVVIVGCSAGGVIFTEPDDWLRPLTKADFMKRLLSRQEIAKWIIKRTSA